MDKLATRDSVARAPGMVPIFGHLLAFARRPLEFLQSLRQYGDIVQVRFGTNDYYVVNCPELIDLMLVRQGEDFQRGRVFDKARAIWGNGLISTDGDFHLRQRRMVMPAFHTERLRTYSGLMRLEAERIVTSWRDGNSIDLRLALHELSCPSLTRSLFSYSIDDARVDEITYCLTLIFKGILWRTVSPDFFTRMPTPSNRRFEKARHVVWNIVREIIEDYLRDPVDRGDLLSMLIAARSDTGDPMSSEQLYDEVMTLLVAGTETTTSVLSWLFYELDRRPDLYARHLAEVDTVVGDRAVQYDDIPKLEFTSRLINESLRLYTPNWFIIREAKTAVDLKGYLIPAGAQMLYSPTTMHRDEKLYENADTFNPDRWEQRIDKTTCIPFGAGRHKCLGDRFGMMEMVIFMATISARWRLAGVPGQNITMAKSVVLHPRQQKMITFERPRDALLNNFGS